MGGLLKAWIGVLLVCLCGVLDALRMEVPGSSTKCIADDIQPQVLTVGDYNVVSPTDGSGITVRVCVPLFLCFSSCQIIALFHYGFEPIFFPLGTVVRSGLRNSSIEYVVFYLSLKRIW